MKKSQFSYQSGRAFSHASIQKFRLQTIPQSKQLPKQKIQSKPNIKYYNNTNQNKNQIAIAKNMQHRKTQPITYHTNNKNEQEIKRKIQLLQYELKKKITQDCYMSKFLKCKTTGELSHIDLYLEMRRLQQQLQLKIEKIAQQQQKLQQCEMQIRQLLDYKQNYQLHEQKHTKQITSFTINLQKIQKKHLSQLHEKQKIIQQQRKIKEEKDLLLKQFRKKYQQCLKMLNMMQRDAKIKQQEISNYQHMWRQKIENLEEGCKIKEGQWMDQIEKYRFKVRESQQLFRQLQQKNKNKQKVKQKQFQQLQVQLSNKSSLINQQSKQIKQYKLQLQNIRHESQQQNKIIQSLNKQLQQIKNILHQNQTKYCKTLQQITKQLNQAKNIQRDQQNKNQKLTKQITKLQDKLNQTIAMHKTVCYDRDQKQTIIKKLRSSEQQNQKVLQDKQKYIQQLQCKIFTIQRKQTGSIEHIKQLQKQISNNKQQQTNCSKIQIQNYKCIGRLTQLTNQINLLIAQDQSQHIKQQKSKSDKLTHMKNKPGTQRNKQKNKFKQVQQQKIQTVTTCIDNLTKRLQIFTKQIYKQTLSQNKQLKQLIQQIIGDIKSIFRTYNSYIQDQQLQGATRQYIECLESQQKKIKKQRNNYLQIIMERLISMVAIQSYTSQNGMKRNYQSKTKFSSRRHTDSLQNTCSNWQEQQPQYKPSQQKKYNGMNRTKISQSSQDEQNQRYNSRQADSRRKISRKLITQPNQILIQNYSVRKLQYGKQNYMNRINRNDNNIGHKYKYLAGEDKIDVTNNYKKYFQDKKPITIPKMKNFDSQVSYNNKEKERNIEKQYKNIRKQTMGSQRKRQMVEKKYFKQ